MGEDGGAQIRRPGAGNDQGGREFGEHLGMQRGGDHRGLQIRALPIGADGTHGRRRAGGTAGCVRGPEAAREIAGVALDKVRPTGPEHADRSGLGQSVGRQPRRLLGAQHASSRTTENTDLMRLVGFQQFPIDGGHVLGGCGECGFRTLPIGDTDHLEAAEGGDGQGFGDRTGVGADHESAAMDMDQHPPGICLAALRGEHARRHAANGLLHHLGRIVVGHILHGRRELLLEVAAHLGDVRAERCADRRRLLDQIDRLRAQKAGRGKVKGPHMQHAVGLGLSARSRAKANRGHEYGRGRDE